MLVMDETWALDRYVSEYKLIIVRDPLHVRKMIEYNHLIPPLFVIFYNTCV